MKMPFINDFVVKEDICNMNCEYCLTGISEFKDSKWKKAQKNSLVYADDSQLKKNMDTITDSIFDAFGVSVLKISGGEILLVKGVIDYIRKHAPKYKKFQLLTNGVFLTPDVLTQLKKIENLCLQISIDHHTIEGNEYRIRSFEKLQHILDNLACTVQSGIPVEINCVLHDKNAHIISSFADYLLKYENNAMLLPFPVRGKNKEAFYPKADQLYGIEELVNRYEDYQSILPPKAYLEYLLLFLREGKRRIPCIFPKIAIGSFDDGSITPCANYWFTSLGNVLKERPQTVFESVGRDRIYKILMHERHHPIECSQCFTPWEVLSLYAEGMLSIVDLKKLPLYAFEGLEECLSDIKTKESNL